MDRLKLTGRRLRKLALAAQGLDNSWKLPKGKEAAALAIERLGHLQIDTISVVERAHHHILWTRCPGYSGDLLSELQSEERRVFEWWYRRVACYLPMCDYRFHAVHFRPLSESDYDDAMKHIMARIRSEGPLGSADFADTRGQKRGSWWDWKPAKRNLEKLFAAGHLMVSARRNFQRLYDLPEHVLPPELDTSRPAPEEQALFEIRRTVSHLGFSPANQWLTHTKKEFQDALATLLRTGELVTGALRNVSRTLRQLGV